MPLLLQVLRVRHPPAASARARRGAGDRSTGAATRHRVKELLVLTGETPEHNAGVAARLAEYGFDDFTAYVVWACEQALERGLLPTPTSASSAARISAACARSPPRRA